MLILSSSGILCLPRLSKVSHICMGQRIDWSLLLWNRDNEICTKVSGGGFPYLLAFLCFNIHIYVSGSLGQSRNTFDLMRNRK